MNWMGRTIEHIQRFPSMQRLPLPTEGDIREFEQRVKLRLPETYKSFVTTFGCGDLGEFFKIYSPIPQEVLCAVPEAARDDIALMNDNVHLDDSYYRDQNAPRLDVAKVFYFSETYGGDKIGWDLARNKGEDSFEYVIVGRGRDSTVFTDVADSFDEFVKGAIDGEVMKNLGYTSDGTCPSVFEPWLRRP